MINLNFLNINCVINVRKLFECIFDCTLKKHFLFVTMNIKPNIIKEYNSEFKNNDSWGWNKVVSLDTILNQEAYLDPEGSLILNFGIRAETYYQIYKDLQEAVKYENSKIKKLKK